MLGSYLTPGPHVLESQKQSFQHLRSHFSTTHILQLSGLSSALTPRTLQWTAIFSFLLMPKGLIVYLALGIQVSGLWAASAPWLPGSVCVHSPPHRHWGRACRVEVRRDFLLFTVILCRDGEEAQRFSHFALSSFSVFPSSSSGSPKPSSVTDSNVYPFDFSSYWTRYSPGSHRSLLSRGSGLILQRPR